MFGSGGIRWTLKDEISQVESADGETCAWQACELKTGSDVMFWCSYAHWRAWWDERDRETA